jgi:hypothetical protein
MQIDQFDFIVGFQPMLVELTAVDIDSVNKYLLARFLLRIDRMKNIGVSLLTKQTVFLLLEHDF